MTDLVVSARLTLDNKGYVTGIQQAESETKRFAQGAAALSGKAAPLDAAGIDAATRALAKSNQELALTARNAMVLERAEAQLNAQLAKGQISQSQHADALRRVQTELKGTGNAADSAANHSNRLGTAVQTVGRYALGLIALGAISTYASQALILTEGYQKLQAQLKLTSDNSYQLEQAQGAVLRIAKDTGGPLNEMGQLWGRLSPVMKEAGYAQSQVGDISEIVAKSLRLSNASTSESASTMLQFSQSMASGVMRGEEFNSLMENSPVLMRKLAEGLGVPVGALRKMAEEGELTADRVVAALLKSKDAIDRDFAKMPKTVSMAWQSLTNEVTLSLGEFDKGVGVTQGLAKAIDVLTENLGTVATAIGVVVGTAGTLAVLTPIGATLAVAAGAAVALAKGLDLIAEREQARYAEQEKALRQQEAENKIAKEINAARLKMREIKAPEGYEEALVQINQAMREGRLDAKEAGAAMNAYVEAANAGAAKLAKAKSNFENFLPNAAKVKKALADLDAEYKLMQDAGIASESVYQARRDKIIQDALKDEIKVRGDLQKEAITRELSAEDQKIAALIATEKQRIEAAKGNEGLIRAAHLSTTLAVKALMLDEVAATKKTAEDRYKEIKANLDKATAEEQKYAGVVASLQSELSGKKDAWADADRERTRAAMSESSAELDKLKEVDEKLAAAAEARRSGDEESAKALAEQSLKLAGNIKNTNERTDAEKKSREVIEASYKAQIDKNVELGRSATARKDELVAAENAQKSELDAITARLGDLDAALKSPRTMDIDTSAAISRLDEVKRKIDAINAEGLGSGNAAASNGDDTLFTPSTGTIIRRAAGGRLYGPGTPTSDSILMRGSVDEFMVRAASARRVGYDVMDYINRYGELPPGRATGGRIGQPTPALPAGFAAPPTTADAAGSGNTYHIAQVVLPDVRDFDGFVRQLEERSRTQPLRINTMASGRRSG